MNGVTQRVEYRGAFVRYRRIEPPHIILGDRDVFGERAIAIDADNLDAFADVRLPGAAEKAREIGDVSFRGDALPDANRAHRSADRGNRSHELVSDHERGLDPALGPRIPRVDMAVRSAKTGLLYADQYVAGADLGYRNLGQEKAGGRARLNEGPHRQRHEGAVISRERAGNPGGLLLLGENGEIACRNEDLFVFTKREVAETLLRHLDVNRRTPLGNCLDLDERAGRMDVLRGGAKVVGSVRVARDLQSVGPHENDVSRYPPDRCGQSHFRLARETD